jgi:hypothetical protein
MHNLYMIVRIYGCNLFPWDVARTVDSSISSPPFKVMIYEYQEGWLYVFNFSFQEPSSVQVEILEVT